MSLVYNCHFKESLVELDRELCAEVVRNYHNARRTRYGLLGSADYLDVLALYSWHPLEYFILPIETLIFDGICGTNVVGQMIKRGHDSW
jgi:hypothetical protein